MLGITVADAIAFGMLILGVLAAARGLAAGKAAKITDPPESSVALIGGAIVDRTTLAALTEAVKCLAEVIERATDDRQRAMQDRIDALLKRLEENENRRR